ncbi:hypothetical protein ACHAXR_011715 [Thalassiosira sp. AJA248-18]
MKSILFLSLLPLSTWAFVTPSSTLVSQRQQQIVIASSQSVALSAKKNKKNRSSGEGFGKSSSSSSAPSSVGSAIEEEATDDASTAAPRALQSINNNAAQQQSPAQQLNLDPNLSDEEKSQEILRQKFGLKSYEEQQADIGDYRAILDAENKKEKRNKLRNLDQVWPEEKDFIAVLPPGVIKGIDSFLKLGLGVTTTAFLASGVLITIEAGSKASLYEIPEGLEDFVVNVIQPNFTPGLGVLLAFSVSLGLFSVGLGGSASSSYKESP